MSGLACIHFSIRCCRSAICRLLALLILGTPHLYAQKPADSSSEPPDAKPAEVAYCDLSKNPAAYNHKLVRLTGFISFAFEDFSLFDPACIFAEEDVSIWLTYGGTSKSGAIYCCPGEGSKENRSQDVSVEDTSVPLRKDKNFADFRALLIRERDTTVRATLIGRFFSGNVGHGQRKMPGYGHMGCCSLFVIQQIESFDPHDRTDLDYSANAGWYEAEGCKFNSMKYLSHASHWDDTDSPAQKIIAAQHAADNGEGWRFSDPKGVALEALSPFYVGQNIELKLIKQSQTAYVVRWKHDNKSTVAVVIRPYWLSFYAKTQSVTWVATMLKEAECEHK